MSARVSRIGRHGGGGDVLLLGVELVDQLHDGGDAGVEVPAGFEILGDLAEGLVELAEDLAVGLAGARFGAAILRVAKR